LLAEVRDSSNSGEQLLSICAPTTESEGTTVSVSSRASSRCLQFDDLTDGSSSIGGFVLGSGEVVFSDEPPSLLHLGFLCFSFFPSVQTPSPFPHPPPAAAPFPRHPPCCLRPAPPTRRPPRPLSLSLLWLRGRRRREEEDVVFAKSPLGDFKYMCRNLFHFKIAITFVF
jgi:hypothetical protein